MVQPVMSRSFVVTPSGVVPVTTTGTPLTYWATSPLLSLTPEPILVNVFVSSVWLASRMIKLT